MADQDLIKSLQDALSYSTNQAGKGDKYSRVYKNNQDLLQGKLDQLLNNNSLSSTQSAYEALRKAKEEDIKISFKRDRDKAFVLLGIGIIITVGAYFLHVKLKNLSKK